MIMALPHFSFYPGDFLAGVQGFTKPQRGDYITLLCYQWANGSIPTDEDELQMVCGGPVHPKVMAKFPDGKNARLEKERGRAEERSDKAKSAADARWKPKHMPEQCSNDANAYPRAMRPHMRPHPPSICQQEQEQEQDLEQGAKAPTVGKPTAVVYSADFEAFWSIYPKKTGKGAAWEAWQKRKKPVPDIDAILPALRRAMNSSQWIKDGGQFIPMPTTWINQRRWEDGGIEPSGDSASTAASYL